MNVACSMRSAWEVIQTLAQRANLQAKRQLQIQVGRRVTFQGPPPRQEEAKEGTEQINTSSRPQEANNRLSFAPLVGLLISYPSLRGNCPSTSQG